MAEFDSRKPSVARVYDSLIGGKDNFDADREVLRRLSEICRDLAKFGVENKHFLERAVTFVAEHGAGQFIDLGAGIPQPPVTHEIARAVLPDARAAYVDNDPQVLAHLTAWYGNNDEHVTVVNADLADRDAVLAAVRGDLDLSRPCCLILGLVLHFFEAAAARDLVAAYLDAVAPGSYLVASSVHSSHERAPELWATYSEAVRTLYPHPPEVFASFFGSAELVPPGVGEARGWRPGWTSKWPADGARAVEVLCAVARTRRPPA